VKIGIFYQIYKATYYSILWLFFTVLYIQYYTRLQSKQCWVVLTQNWVKYGQTQNVGLKMLFKILTQLSTVHF